MSFSVNNGSYREQLRECLHEQPIFIDTETTGLANNSTVIEIAVVDWHGTVLLNSLVRPFAPIPAAASAVHGISTADTATAPTWQELWYGQLADILAGRILGIYNASFDLRMMAQTHRAAGYHVWREPRHLCVMQLFAAYYQRQDNLAGVRSVRAHKLSFAGQHFGIELPNSHRALADAQLARMVLQKLVETVVN